MEIEMQDIVSEQMSYIRTNISSVKLHNRGAKPVFFWEQKAEGSDRPKKVWELDIDGHVFFTDTEYQMLLYIGKFPQLVEDCRNELFIKYLRRVTSAEK